jgi:tRNA(Arg) A34 adenosine deaminase TadA
LSSGGCELKELVLMIEDSRRAEAERFLRIAIEEGERAARDGNTPYGAVLVAPDGTVAATGRNQSAEQHDPSSHAELNAVRDVCRARGTLVLPGYRMYASGQPCPMCMTAMIRVGLAEVWYAAPAAPGTALISPEELAERAGDEAPEVIGGVLADEALRMMASSTSR